MLNAAMMIFAPSQWRLNLSFYFKTLLRIIPLRVENPAKKHPVQLLASTTLKTCISFYIQICLVLEIRPVAYSARICS